MTAAPPTSRRVAGKSMRRANRNDRIRRSIAGFAVALLCLISWRFRLSMLVRLISDSILVEFKAGAGMTIIMTQLPSLLGVAGGGHNFFERVMLLAGQLGQIRIL